MKYDIYESFIEAVNHARRVNLQLQLRQKLHGVDRFLGERMFAAEYKTVSINVGRQTGKTTYIINNAGPADLVITRNEMLKKHIKDIVWPRALNVVSVGFLKSQSQQPYLGEPNLRDMMFRDIYVDECDQLDLDTILEVCNFSNQIIMFGSLPRRI